MPFVPLDKNIAILAANGFDEHQMTEIQRALTKAGARLCTIAPENGVVNGWQGDNWGHHYHVDRPIGEALGSDFDMLVLPGGARGVAKLKQNAHARRIVNHFLDANKRVAAIGEGVELLELGTAFAGRKVAQKGAGVVTDGNLLSSDGEDLVAWVEAAVAFFAGEEQISRAA